MIYIKEKIDKAEVSEMEVVTFPGRIIVIQTELEAEKAVNFLLTQPMVGVDTETRPSFKRGATNKVALLQVSTYDTCFLFRLNMIGMSVMKRIVFSNNTGNVHGCSFLVKKLSLYT